MILLIDIGNSRIKIGLCKNPNIKNKIDVFYCDNIKKINSVLKEIGISKFDSVLVSSVVPEINKNVIKIIEDNLKITPTFINSDLTTGIKFNYSPISDIGPDRIADCVAANNNYDKKKFKIVVDFGTATVFEVISNNGEFLGGSIFPGLEVASKALALKASLLSEINFDEWNKNQKVLGNNTDEALKSSIYWGYISPPRIYIENNANNVVIDVIIVLAKVSLIDKLETSLILIFVNLNKFSLIRS